MRSPIWSVDKYPLSLNTCTDLHCLNIDQRFSLLFGTNVKILAHALLQCCNVPLSDHQLGFNATAKTNKQTKTEKNPPKNPKPTNVDNSSLQMMSTNKSECKSHVP